MQAIYISGSVLAFIGVILLWLSFFRHYRGLTLLQKTALLVTTIGVLIPMCAGFITGMTGH